MTGSTTTTLSRPIPQTGHALRLTPKPKAASSGHVAELLAPHAASRPATISVLDPQAEAGEQRWELDGGRLRESVRLVGSARD